MAAHSAMAIAIEIMQSGYSALNGLALFFNVITKTYSRSKVGWVK